MYRMASRLQRAMAHEHESASLQTGSRMPSTTRDGVAVFEISVVTFALRSTETWIEATRPLGLRAPRNFSNTGKVWICELSLLRSSTSFLCFQHEATERMNATAVIGFVTIHPETDVVNVSSSRLTAPKFSAKGLVDSPKLIKRSPEAGRLRPKQASPALQGPGDDNFSQSSCIVTRQICRISRVGTEAKDSCINRKDTHDPDHGV